MVAVASAAEAEGQPLDRRAVSKDSKWNLWCGRTEDQPFQSLRLLEPTVGSLLRGLRGFVMANSQREFDRKCYK